MKFIVIEGLDGAGKSTQIKQLQNKLEEKGIKYKYLHFPRTDSPIFGDLVAKFLRGELGDIGSVNPYLVALIYAGDRNDAAKMINEWMDTDHLVIIDRYVYSNIAFQCAKIKDNKEKAELSDWIKNYEYEYNKIPKPDLSIFLDVPFNFTKKKLTEVRTGDDRDYLNGKKDIHEEDLSFQEQVREVYLTLTENEKDFNRINCNDDNTGEMLPPVEIFSKINALLEEKNIY